MAKALTDGYAIAKGTFESLDEPVPPPEEGGARSPVKTAAQHCGIATACSDQGGRGWPQALRHRKPCGASILSQPTRPALLCAIMWRQPTNHRLVDAIGTDGNDRTKGVEDRAASLPPD